LKEIELELVLKNVEIKLDFKGVKHSEILQIYYNLSAIQEANLN